MKRRRRTPRLVGSVSVSLLGSIVPSLIGVVGTVLAARSDNHQGVIALLVAWTVIGYLMLTDFGLTRASSKLVAANEHSREAVVAALWRVAVPLGVVVTAGVAVVLFVITNRIEGPGTGAIRILCVVPILAALQFPLVGALEAGGRFGTLAAQRTFTATFTYLFPALAIQRVSDGLVIAVVSITAYRAVSLATMWHRLELNGRIVARLLLARNDERREVPVGGVVMWVAVSSLIGPLLLYVDRIFLGTLSISKEMWIFYVSLSEILIKSYMIPAAVLSACFPWLVVNIRSRASLVRRLFVSIMPAASTAVVALIAAMILVFLPEGSLSWAGLPSSDASNGKLVAAVAISCTVLNWVSQAYIAVLQAVDRQKRVALVQLAIAVPYVLALCCAQFIGGIGVLSATWGARIIIVWVFLVGLSRQSLPSHTGSRTADAQNATKSGTQ